MSTNNSPDHLTTGFMNGNGGNFPEVSNGGGDATSGGRLLSTSGEEKPRVTMTRPARLRIRVILAVLLISVIIIAVVLIAALTTRYSRDDNKSNFEELDQSKPYPVSHEHIRCNNDVMVGGEGDNSLWRHYKDSHEHIWKIIPNVENVGFVLISPKYQLEAGYPGVQVSVHLPEENARFHIMAVTPSFEHTKTVTIHPGKYRCESAAIIDPKIFNGDEVVFRIYVFYRKQMPLKGLKFTVTSLPLAVRYKALTVHSTITSTPDFKTLSVGYRDVCSVEIENSERLCNWWNIEDGDSAEMEPVERHECVASGASTSKDATWFFAVGKHEVHHESRALLISPIIKRDTPSILLTMWFLFKCEGPHLRVHLVPAEKTGLRRAVAASSPVASIANPASHNDWKFVSFQISLPPEHDAYHLVLEAIVISNGNCTGHVCTYDGHYVKDPDDAKTPMLGVDSITIEHMHEQCENTTGASVADCTFQTENGTSTICGWKSSGPPIPPQMLNLPGMESNFFDDWKAVNSGDDSDHGATSQHFEGRGYIMSFDASGRAGSESYFRTPLLIANNNCSCVMEFQYLMRGYLTPRLQVNMIYGEEVEEDGTRELQPRWSLLGHQSDDWEVASITLNLKRDSPFQIEVRVLDIGSARGDVHFDDMHFIGCDMEKYSST